MEKIDDIISKLLKNYAEEPSDDLWYKIERKLKIKSFKMKLYNIIDFVLLSVIVITAFVYNPDVKTFKLINKIDDRSEIFVGDKKIHNNSILDTVVWKKSQQTINLNKTSINPDPIEKINVEKINTIDVDTIHKYLNKLNLIEKLEIPKESDIVILDTIYPEIIESTKFVLYIPTSYSPNFDGLNDYFVIPNINETESNLLYIYDIRNGEIIFSEKDYKNNWSCYDCESNFYVYVLMYKYNNEQKIIKGTVYIVK